MVTNRDMVTRFLSTKRKEKLLEIHKMLKLKGVTEETDITRHKVARESGDLSNLHPRLMANQKSTFKERKSLMNITERRRPIHPQKESTKLPNHLNKFKNTTITIKTINNKNRRKRKKRRNNTTTRMRMIMKIPRSC